MLGRIKNMKLRYKVGMGVATGAAILGGGGAAFAYFTTTGSGTGTGTVGSSQALTIHQTGIVYGNAGNDNALVPGTSATVTFTVDNPSSGHQQLGTIHLQSWSSNKAGCNSSADNGAETTWITMPDVAVNQDYAPGSGQAVTPTGTITFNNLATTDQSACKGATLTFNYTA